jgi:Tol biopolymer transport system component
MLRLAATVTLAMNVLFGIVVSALSQEWARETGVQWQVIFIAHVPEEGMVGRIMNPDGSDVQPVILNGQPTFYLDCSPDGNSLIFMAGHSAYVARGDEVRQIEAETISAIDVSVSNNGEIIFSGGRQGSDGVYVLNPATNEAIEIASRLPANRYSAAVMYDLSPEGRQVAYHTLAESNLYIMEINGAVRTRLPGVAFGAAWSPDGTMVAFAADWDGNFEIYVLDVNHSLTAQLTRRTRGYGNTFPAWSPDGRQIVYIHASSSGLGSSYGGDLYAIHIGDSNQRRLAHFNDEVVMGCWLTARPAVLTAAS